MVQVRIRDRYERCRELISLNNECLEVLTGLQEDLRFVPPRRDVIGERVAVFFDRADRIVWLLESLASKRYPALHTALRSQRAEIETFVSSRQELVHPRLAARLSEVDAGDAAEVGSKAAVLGEVRRRLGIPVPDGYVLTTEAYRIFVGVPRWDRIRDAARTLAAGDLETLQRISIEFTEMVAAAPLPRALEVALVERAQGLARGGGLAVRSSACGEGGMHTFAGQFDSRINVPAARVVEAYRQVVASRFSQRALSYRLSSGIAEVDSPMAVLVLPTIHARASGVLYTRDPAVPRSKTLWITATWGLGLGVAGGSAAGDLFVVSRARGHAVVEARLAHKAEELAPNPAGGVLRRAVDAARADAPSLEPDDLAQLARWGVELEKHFGSPQDVEWALDEDGRLWVLQARPLVMANPSSARRAGKVRREPLVTGGRTIFPGRTSGPAHVVQTRRMLNHMPMARSCSCDGPPRTSSRSCPARRAWLPSGGR